MKNKYRITMSLLNCIGRRSKSYKNKFKLYRENSFKKTKVCHVMGESQNKYENEANGIFSGQCHCMKTRRKVLCLFQDYFRIPPCVFSWVNNRTNCLQHGSQLSRRTSLIVWAGSSWWSEGKNFQESVVAKVFLCWISCNLSHCRTVYCLSN